MIGTTISHYRVLGTAGVGGMGVVYSQLLMFRLFGVSEAQKRRVIYDTGHNIPRPDLIRETLDWLDRYVGPVKSSPSP